MLQRVTLILVGFVVLLLALAAVQAAARNRSNPPVLSEPSWDSSETRQLARRACFDCHSNETRWPLYSRLPFVSRIIEDHVVEGRDHLNFSEWGVPGREQEEGEEAAEKVFEPRHYAGEDGPLGVPYSLLHPRSRLSRAEREQLARGLIATLGGEGSWSGEGNEAQRNSEGASQDQVDDGDD